MLILDQTFANGRNLDARTPLLPEHVCFAAVCAVDAELKSNAGDNEAAHLGRMLTGQFGAQEAKDPKVYTRTVCALFMAYPTEVGKRVIDPVHGWPGKSKFLPSAPELKEALESELARRKGRKFTALAMVQERKRREAEKAEEAEFDRNRGSAEQRKAQVDALLGSLRQI